MLSSKNQSSSLNERSVVNGITKALKGLIAVIEKENASLKIGQISNIGMVVEQKIEAISKFNDAEYDIKDYAKAGGKFDQNSSSMKKLKELFSKLDVVKKDNEVFIRSNLEVSDQIVEMYKEHKKQETMRQYGYDKNGNISSEKMKNVMPAVGLNNKV